MAENPIIKALAPAAKVQTGGGKSATTQSPPTAPKVAAPAVRTGSAAPSPSPAAPRPTIRQDRQAALMAELGAMGVEVVEITAGNTLASAARGMWGDKLEVLGVDLRLGTSLLGGMGGAFLMKSGYGAGRHVVRLFNGVLQSYVADTAQDMGRKMAEKRAGAGSSPVPTPQVKGEVGAVSYPQPIRTVVRNALAAPPPPPVESRDLDTAEVVAGRRRLIAHTSPAWDEPEESVGAQGDRERLQRRRHPEEDEPHRGRAFRQRHDGNQSPTRRMLPILPLRERLREDGGESYEG